MLARWVGQAKGAYRLIELHDWLEDQTMPPEDALWAYYYEPHSETQATPSGQFSAAAQTSAPSPAVGIPNPGFSCEKIDIDADAADFEPFEAAHFVSHRIHRSKKQRTFCRLRPLPALFLRKPTSEVLLGL